MGAPASQGFPATDRFELLAELGSGGMGVVYAARDVGRSTQVALKALRTVGAREVLRLKTEFRALRDLLHPNLIRLGELFEQQGRWFFTMELVDGVDFLRWVRPWGGVRPGGPPSLPTAIDDRSQQTRIEPAAAAAVRMARGDEASGRPYDETDEEGADGEGDIDPSLLAAPGFDEVRLRAGLRGVVAGLAALHRAGLVHRDIKPSNILVEASGRVVLLDFGVVGELRASTGREAGLDATVDDDLGDSGEPVAGGAGEIVGTWAYMAPEQGAGAPVGAAADWYAVGVMLFEALTGRTPFSRARSGLERKSAREAPSPAAFTRDLPGDLVALCRRLLERDPARRPADDELMQIFGVDGATVAGAIPFVGRGSELAALHATFQRHLDGEPICLFIVGESGVGKTALVRRWVEETAAAEPGLLVLRGRCDEREIVPFNAFDGMVDSLARFLARVPAEEAAALVPAGAGELLRLFPVLQSVPALASATRRRPRVADARSVAFAALADLLRGVAATRSVVLIVDDLHWADGDSAGLLRELMNGPGAPRLFLVATARWRTGTPPPRALSAPRTATVTLRLEGLSPTETERLVDAIVATTPGAVCDAAAIARETGGHPLFVAELARHLSRHPGAEALQLDDALWHRSREQDEAARRLVEVVAIAGGLELEAAAAVTGLGPEPFAAAVSTLRAARLVRVGGRRDDDRLEPYHDRLREAVVARLPDADRVAWHRRLAEVLAARDAAPERLAHHLAGAGERAGAAVHAEAAARRAAAAFAFGSAAEWMQAALELGEHPPERQRALRAELGELSTRAGRPEAAAAAFLAAAETGEPDADERRSLRRRAVEQYLLVGRLDEGLAGTESLLAEVGIGLPPSPARAVVSLVWQELRLRATPLRWTPRREAEVPAAELLRLDACWSAALGLSMVDSMRGALLAIRGARMCLRAGEPARIARALASTAFVVAGTGRGHLFDRYRAAAVAAAAQSGTAVSQCYVGAADACRAFFVDNDWSTALAVADRTAHTWHAAGLGRGWESDILEQLACWALNSLGELGQQHKRVPAVIRAAQRDGDRFLEIGLRTFFPVVHLVRDASDEADADVEEALASWLPGRNQETNQFFFAMKGRSLIALYRGDVEERFAGLDAPWEQTARALLARVPMVRYESCLWRAQLAVACAASAQQRGDATAAAARAAQARRWIRMMRRIGVPSAASSILQLQAGLAHLAGDDASAIAALRQALVDLEPRGVVGPVHAARWHLAELIGGDEGRALRETAQRWFDSQGVVNAARMAAAMLPGWEHPGRS